MLHLSRFSLKRLIYNDLWIFNKTAPVTTLPPKRVSSFVIPLHLFRTAVASLRDNPISACAFNALHNPPVSLPVVTCKSFFAVKKD